MAGLDMLPLTRSEDRCKHIHFHGIWDIDELYDFANDLHENAILMADRKPPFSPRFFIADA